MLLGAVVTALVVAVIATIAAIRAGNRARRAAALVSQLLEPVEVTEMVLPDDVRREASASGSGDRRADARATDRSNATRIPVLDLDRLRVWLTDGDVEMGRIAVVSVEIDNLASVYDRFGARAGVELVESITQRLRTLTRPRDVVAHVNHDRFVLVCRDVPDRAAAEALSQRVALGVSHPSVLVAGVAEVSASIGVALAAGNDESPQSVLRRAVEAGKQARELGGGRVEIAPTLTSSHLSEGELATSIARDELRLHYLPIVSCATGRVAGFEALVRWEHAQRGLLNASEFVGDAERTGAIVAIGNWALEEGCRQLAEWHAGDGAHAEAQRQRRGAPVRGADTARSGQADHQREWRRARRRLARDHRGDPAPGSRDGGPLAATAPRRRRAPRDRRLRVGRVVARVAEALSDRRDQDRPVVRRRPRARSRR